MRTYRAGVTVTLLVVMTAVYVAALASAWSEQRRLYADPAQAIGAAILEAPLQFLAEGAITPDLLVEKDWSRLITAVFLHAGLMHLIYNAWAMLQFGALLETLCGSVMLLATFLLSGVFASAASSIFLSVEYSVGASGAIFGVCGALVVVLGAAGRSRRSARVLQWQLALWAATAIAGGFLSPRIDNVAHVSGCGAGAVIGLFLRRRVRAERHSSSSRTPPTGSR